MKTVSSKQFYLLIFFITIISKLIYLPSTITLLSGKDAYFVLIFWFIFDGLFLFLLLLNFKKYKSSFFKLLQDRLNPSVFKLLLIVFTFYFFIKLILFILESTALFETSFYASFMNYEFYVLLFFFILYGFSLSFRTILRALELLKIVFLLGLIFILIVSFMNSNFIHLLPVFENGIFPLTNAIKNSAVWFGDFTVLFLLLGKVEIRQKFVFNSMMYYIIASVISTIVVVCFAASFSNDAGNQTIAIYNLLTNMSGNSAFSKLDWLFVSIWSIAFLFMTIILSYITFIFFQEILYKIKVKISALIFVSILFLFLLLSQFQTQYFYSFIKSITGIILLIQYVISFLILMLLFLKGGQFNEKQKTKNLL